MIGVNDGARPPATPLGFGCAGLLRLPSATEQDALLAAAYDAGVRHFDVARMYGLGRAEAVVGRFAATRRENITLTTKFGIQVGEGLAKASRVQTLGRWAIRHVPGLRGLVKGRLGGSTVRDFSLGAARASVERSFEELGLDTVDYLLLHEPLGVEGIEEELVGLLEELRASGRIGAFGTAAEWGPLQAVTARFPALARVVQAPAPTGAMRRDPVLAGAERVFTFGHLAEREALAARLKGRADAVAALGLEPGDRDVAGLLLLRRAALQNPEGSTLFFTSSRERLAKTARFVLRPAEEGESERLAELLEPDA